MSIVVYAITKPYPVVERFKEEEVFHDPVNKTKVKFPSIEDEYTLNLSVIVPAYNEEKRCKLYIYFFLLVDIFQHHIIFELNLTFNFFYNKLPFTIFQYHQCLMKL